MKKLTIIAVLLLGILAINANAQVFLSGTVRDPNGFALGQTHILFYTCPFPDSAPNCNLMPFAALTNPFGNFSYTFPVWAGQTYIVQASHKAFVTNTQIVNMNDSVDLQITLQPTQ